MKIQIITLHSIYNPGSVFQAYALQLYLLKEGYSAEIIDYRPAYSTVGKNKIKGYLRKVLFYKNQKILKRKYEDFINTRMILTKRYSSYRSLSINPPSGDVYVTGSDQLWNMDYDCGRDLSFYLKFVPNSKKIAYSTSIGKNYLPKDELEIISDRIIDFSAISVREESAAKLLSSKMRRNVSWVCDPVFLLSAEDYLPMVKRIVDEKYVVVYLADNSDLLDAIVQNIKEKTNYKIVLIGGNRTRCYCDKHMKDMGPYDFLSMIVYAEIIISSSFHATAFSLIFNKKFGAILPPKNGERIESLLNLCNLTNRIIRKNEDISRLYSPINYSEVNNALDEFIYKSKKILINSIEE